MTKPVILSVDDDREVLAAVERDLRKQYRARYRIVTAASGQEALEAARELKRRGTPVALFLVDQRMPMMTGTQLLTELRKLYPRRQARAADRLRRYRRGDRGDQRRRPAPLPDEAVGSAGAAALSGARRSAGRMVGQRRACRTRASGSPDRAGRPRAFVARDFLSRNQIPYQWIDIDTDAPTRELVQSTGRRPVAAAGRVLPGRHSISSRPRTPNWRHASVFRRSRRGRSTTS